MSERILVVGPSWVGDMVMAQTLLKSLSRTRPGVAIDIMAPAASLAVTERMPELDRRLGFEVGHGQFAWSYRRDFARKLNHAEYQQAIVLPNSAKSALVPWFAGIPTRTGFLGEMRWLLLNDIRPLDKKKLPRMIDRFVALGDEAKPTPQDYPRLAVDIANQQNCLSVLQLDLARPILALCPGAEFGDAKRWPERHFATLADFAIAENMQVWLFGSPSDRPVAEAIRQAVQHSKHCVDLTGKTTLADALDLLALARHVVSNDSGLMHIAAAVGAETTVLYGSTSAEFTPPLSERANILNENLSCSPCFERICPLGHKNCLNNLAPERVYPLIRTSLAGPS